MADNTKNGVPGGNSKPSKEQFGSTPRPAPMKTTNPSTVQPKK